MNTTSSYHPKISIVIPVFNCETYIEQSIRSVAKQTYDNFELIVVDDGSTDSTPEILKKLASQYNFVLIKQGNLGQSAAMSTGWEASTGEILGYLSSDDLYAPTLLSESYKFFEQEEVILTFPCYDLIDSDSNILKQVNTNWVSYEHLICSLDNPIGPGVLFRKKIFIENGGWNSKLRQVQDLDYWIKICNQGTIKVIHKILASFRVHHESRTFMGTSMAKAEEPIQVIDSFFESNASSRYIHLKQISLSNAYILSAQLHMRAGRFMRGFKYFIKSFFLYRSNLFKYRTFRIFLNGCFSRSYYVAVVPVVLKLKFIINKLKQIT